MDPIPRLPVRQPESHKGDFGRALLVGGSRGMTGAIALAGMAALRSGAGLVTVACPNQCLETIAAIDPCYMTVPLPSDDEGRFDSQGADRLLDLLAHVTAGACGPGLGRSEALTTLVQNLYCQVSTPLIIDADALNALSQHPEALKSPGGPRILTPHPGEFARLVGQSQPDRAAQEGLAQQLAQQAEVVVVLKGHRTFVTDGWHNYHNESGNPGMATGGSGDVLTGVLTALLCQGLDTLRAARLGVHAHGMAGDLAAKQMSMVAMTATDILDKLSAAWKAME